MSYQLTDAQGRPTAARLLIGAMRWPVWLVPLHWLLLMWGTRERQPSPSTEFAAWARFVSTDEFRWSHLIISIGGQTAGVIGTVALTALLVAHGAPIGRSALGLLLHVSGSSLMLSGFGIAAFAQPAIGALHDTEPGVAEEMYHAVYTPTVFVVLLTGLALFSFSTVATGSALTSSRWVPRWAGRLFMLAGPLFGVIGFLFSTFQTVGALLLAVTSAMAARELHRGRPSSGS
jgi:hypothetical protein